MGNYGELWWNYGELWGIMGNYGGILDYVPPEEPLGTPLGNALRIR